MVGVQRARVPEVVVDDGQTDAFGQRAADIEAAPAGIPEVRGALGRDHAVRAGRTGRVQADGPDAAHRHAGQLEYLLHGLDQGLDGLVRPFPDVAGDLGHLVEEELPAGIKDCPVVGGPAVVEAYDNPVDWHASSSSGRRASISLWKC